MFKDACCETYSRPTARPFKNQVSKKNFSEVKLAVENGLDASKICRKSEETYMSTLLEDLSNIDMLMSNCQKHIFTPISKDEERGSFSSRLRMLSTVNQSESNCNDNGFSTSSEETGRVSTFKLPKDIPIEQRHPSEEELKSSLSFESHHESEPYELFMWNEMKASYSSNLLKPKKSNDLVRDDTQIAERPRMKNYQIHP